MYLQSQCLGGHELTTKYAIAMKITSTTKTFAADTTKTFFALLSVTVTQQVRQYHIF
jgi:hypothetical protein